jgi:hypothetical protein
MIMLFRITSILLHACVVLMFCATQAQGQSVVVGRFVVPTALVPAPWEVIRLDQRVAPTQYRVVSWDGVPAVEARAEASMALLARPLEVDLVATPVLCWRWRVDGVVKTADMATKQGDDYAARVYVAFKLPAQAMSLATRARLGLARAIYGPHVPDAAINYVWDNQHAVGTRQANAYTDRTWMIVQRSGTGQAGAWVNERVNVLSDAQQIFGAEKIRASLLALAADTDNTGERTRSGFADLHFVRQDAACDFAPDARPP